MAKVCEECDFLVAQRNMADEEVNMCLLQEREVGLLETCGDYAPKTGNHYTE